MNKIYQIIWNNALGLWVVASELSCGKKKTKSSVANLSTALMIGGLAAVCSPDTYATDYTSVTSDSGLNVILNSGDRIDGPAPYRGYQVLTGLLIASGAGSEITATGITVNSSDANAIGIFSEAGGRVNLINSSVTTLGNTGVTIDHGYFTATGSELIATEIYGGGISANYSTVNLTDTNIKTSGVWGIGLYSSHGETVTLKGGSIVTEGDIGKGIMTSSNNIDITGTTILTKGDTAVGMELGGQGVATVSGGSVTTEGAASHGIEVFGTLNANETLIRVSGDNANGILLYSTAVADLDHMDISSSGNGEFAKLGAAVAVDRTRNAAIRNSTVATSGSDMAGIEVRGISALKQGYIDIKDTDITTTGLRAEGLTTSYGSASMTNGAINTSGIGANGITGRYHSSLLIDGANVNVSGNGSHGVLADDNSYIELNNVNINTSGTSHADRVAGIFAANSTIKASNTHVVSSGFWADGVRSHYNSTIILDGGVVRATGSSGTAVRVNGQFGTTYGISLVTVNGTLLETMSDNASAVSVHGLGKAVLNDATVNTYGGPHSYGLSADSRAIEGAAFLPGGVIEATNTRISTAGQYGYGAYVSDGSEITLTNVSVDTLGQSAFGLIAQASGAWLSPDLANYNAPVITAAGVNITTQGKYAYGALAIANVNAAYLNLDSATLSTQGEQAFGLMTLGSKAEINGSNVQVNTTGVDAAGLVISDSALSVSKINLQNSLVNSQLSDGMLVSTAVGEINLTATDIFGGGGNALNVEDASQLTLNAESSKLYGNLSVSDNSLADVSLINGSMLKGAAQNVTTMDIDNSQWLISADSNVGSLNVKGAAVSFNPPELNKFKTLTAGSLAGNDSTFVLNTVLNDGGVNTQSDKIHITGDATGNHGLVVNNAGGLGALTVGDGIQVVSIDGISDSSFKLGNSVSAGAYEYLLYQGGESDANDWYLRSYLQPTIDPIPDPDDETGPTPVPARDNVILYRPEVAGYIAAPYLNQQYGFDTVGTLHERIGDDVTQGNNDTWARMGGQHRTNEAGRFGYRGDSWFVQFGSDLYQDKTDAGTTVSSGLTVTMGTQNTNTQDHSRSLNPALSVDTGKVVSDAISVGGYYTRMAQDNSYLDLVGQGTYYHNKYESDHSASQNGYGAVLSGEVGKPFALGGKVTLEPQAQLMYQYLYLDSFNDGVSDVDSTSSHSGLARGGLRLSYDAATVKPYVLADVVQRLGGNTSVGIGGTDISADFTSGWWQTGAGVSVQLADDTQVYADAKYQRGFDGGMEGYTGHLGIKVSF